MIKYFKYIFLAAIAMIAATGCQEDWEDTFSKEPAAPKLLNNGTILMTKNTMSESITWAWSAARFLQGEISYTLYTQYGTGTALQIGNATKDLSLTMTKEDFRSLIAGIDGVPQNSSFALLFYVVAADDNAKYESEKESIKVYAYGDAVSAVVTASVPELVLDVNDPAGEVQLLTWEAARLGYNETVTYAVSMSYNGGEAIEVAKDLTDPSCTKTVDEWNELVVAAGAPETQAVEVQFVVTAFSETYPDGVPSAPITVKVTTYKATYPSHLVITGTNKQMSQSTSTKGLFDCYVNLEGSGNVSFKLLDPDSQMEYGSDDAQTATDDKGNVVTSGTFGGNGNITVPAGLYRISADLKFNKLQIVKIESMGIIGSATPNGWDSEIPMTYDAAANTFSVVTTMAKDGEYKFRANNNWGFAIDNKGDFRDGGDNYKFEKETGEYKIILDLNKHPYTAKILDTAFPDQLYIPGAHTGWAKPFTIFISGNGEGHFEGGVNLVNAGGATCEWKFSSDNDWVGSDFAGTITLNDYGYGKGKYGGNGNIATPNGYYYISVDMLETTFEMLRIEKIGLIGGFNSWGGDVDFAYDAVKNVWTVTQALKATDEFKVRFNGSWNEPNPNNQNRGLAATGIVSVGVATPVFHDGGNMKVAEDGTYEIVLDLSTNPNAITVTKK